MARHLKTFVRLVGGPDKAGLVMEGQPAAHAIEHIKVTLEECAQDAAHASTYVAPMYMHDVIREAITGCLCSLHESSRPGSWLAHLTGASGLDGLRQGGTVDDPELVTIVWLNTEPKVSMSGELLE